MSGRLPLFFLTSVVLLLASCAGDRNAQRTPPPEWVNQRPISRMHYIGIGSAVNSPIPGEALRIAKERAAADLIGEIAVRIESSSLLENEDRNGRIRRDFNSTISSRSEERIAGYEVLGVYEGPEAIHVYYRLDKQRHAAARAARKQAAIEVALTEWASGQSDLEAGRVPNALEHWGTGILALEEFWNDINRADIDGQNVAVEPYLIRAMREAIRDLKIRPLVNRVVLSAQGDFRFPLGLHATLDGQNASGVPITYSYHNGTYRKRATEFTDDEGLIVALIERVETRRPDRDIVCTVDIDRLMNSAHLNPIVVELLGETFSPESRVDLDVEMPSVFLTQGAISTLSTPQHTPLFDAMRAVLLDSGCTLASPNETSDYLIEFNFRSEHRTPSGNYGQFHTAYVEGTLALKNRQGQIVHEVRIDRVKGVQLDSEAALLIALTNAAESIMKRHGRALLQGIL